MAGKRIDKFEKQAQKDIGTIFQQKSHDWFGGAFITVTRVIASPDLGYLKIYLSMFNVKNKAELMENIEFRNKEIRKELATLIRHSVKKIPELSFFEDDSLDYQIKMDALFESLKKDNNTES
jgi:ribosome-binding factor A